MQRHDGVDPIEVRRAGEQLRPHAAKAVTFKECVKVLPPIGLAGVRHAAQWEATLATHAEPVDEDGGGTLAKAGRVERATAQ